MNLNDKVYHTRVTEKLVYQTNKLTFQVPVRSLHVTLLTSCLFQYLLTLLKNESFIK